MSSSNINFRTDGSLKSEVKEILSEMGLDFTTVFNMLMIQIAKQRNVPFEVSAPEKPSSELSIKELYGCLQGQVFMSDDFCEPLDEMEEYM